MTSAESFGLAIGQKRRHCQICPGLGWYNERGERIGWGELDYEDFRCIAMKLKENEGFFVVADETSLRGYPNSISRNRLIEDSVFVITKNKFYAVCEGGLYGNDGNRIGSLPFAVISPDSLSRLHEELFS